MGATENPGSASPCKASRLYLAVGVPYEPWVRIFGAVLLPLILLAPSTSEAQKGKSPKGPVGKAAGACGQKTLPLIEGNTWTYGFVASSAPQRDDLAKLTPNQPGTVVITVKTIETKGDDTVVTLEEKTTADISKDPKKQVIDERTITSTITCNATAKKFEISPESFWFAGEPGGFYGIAFEKIERPKDTTWKLANGLIGDAEWREDIVARFTRTPFAGAPGAKLDSGKIELERKFTPQQPERINTKLGIYETERLAITTTGRITLDHPQPDSKPMELPANWVNQLWIVPNLGVVQALNAYSHMYMLTDVQLK